MTDVGQTTPQPSGFFGGLSTLVSTLQDIVRAINGVAENFSSSFVTIAGNNTFTGFNIFDGGIGFKTRVVTAAGTITVSTTDILIVVNKTVGAATTVTLPASPTTERLVMVKDGKGDALANNITIDGNGKTIDGAATLVIYTNYQRAGMIYNGTEWNQVF